MRSAPRSATPIKVTLPHCFGSPSPPPPRRTATLPPGRECGGAPPAVPCGGRSRRGGCPEAPAAVYVRVGVSALSTARFSHGFNIFSQNVTDGVGPLRYSVARARVQRCRACLRARALHIRDHSRWPLAQVRRCRAPLKESI